MPDRLRQVRLPVLGRDVSVLAMNCASSPDVAARQSFDDFYAHGGNAFHVHGEGGETDSRRRLGRWVATQRNRSEVVICSQVCHEGWDPAEQREVDRLNEACLSEDIASDLELLQTDYLDIAYLSRPTEIPVEAVMEILARELAKKRVRTFGVRNWTPAQIMAANDCARQAGLLALAAVITTELCHGPPSRPRWEGYVPFDAAMERVVMEERLTVWAWVDASSAARSGVTQERNIAAVLHRPFAVIGMINPGEREGVSLDALVSAANIIVSDRDPQQQ